MTVARLQAEAPGRTGEGVKRATHVDGLGRHEDASARREAQHAASTGTLFLDEVAELSTPVQPKLLRSLQEREVVRVGSELAAQPIQVDVRVIAASHQDLLELAGVGRFRPDLYYRLCEYTIHVPPLRVRERDVLELARHALSHTAGPQCRLGRDAEHLLLSHPWPGNVRELQAVVIAASIDARSGRIGAAEIKRHLRTSAAQPSAVGGSVAPGPAVVGVGDGRDARILELLSERGASSMGELVSCSGIPRGSVRHLLAKLGGAGRIAREGEGRARRYLLPERTGADGQQPGGGGRHSAALASRYHPAAGCSRRSSALLTAAGVTPSARASSDMFG